ncbi:MAG: NAD(P)/FAD-dependent oxidoreductase [Clostridia bacterium]|nr:NAD(P)/FAD-dependent oxidoreductase [Clostridia bacterium]
MTNYVIIGNGVAAAGCIEGIRAADTKGKITVISEENTPVYCRPLISYYLEGKTDLERMKYRDDSFYQDMKCEVLYNVKAEKIDKEAKTVILSNGKTVSYDKLCVATGSSPFIPPFKGLETVEKKFSFLTLNDALSLEKAINKNSRVLIVGAGLIGLKCAEGLHDRTAEIIVCDLADRILSSILDRECAAIVQSHLEENGIKFKLNDSVVEFNKNIAVMKSGVKIEFDVLVLAVGVKPNSYLIKDIGGKVNRGIVVDNSMRTDLKDIYAVGDCTESEDISGGIKRVMALMPNAYMQGKCAGMNMGGKPEIFDKAIPMNSIGFFGLHVMTAGSYFDSDNGGTVYQEKNKDKVKRFYTKDGLLTGFILVRDTDRAGIYTSIIREKTPLSSLNFEMLQKVSSTAAYSKENRRKKFGGVV